MATQLTHLPEVQRLSPACIRILGGNPGKFTLQGTNTYLVGTGTRRLLIDTGEGKPSWIAALRKTLSEENAVISHALISHWHGDHQGGIKDLLALSADTKVLKNQPGDGQLGIADGQRFSVDGATLTAVHTPGHTVDHMVFVLDEEDALFTADNVLGHGTAVFEDLATYLASLDKMKDLFKGRAYPGHGPVIDDGPAKIKEYISHRQQREDQITQTLRSINDATGIAAWEPMELVKVIYHDVPETLHLPAQGGVIQVLQKLEKEGKVSNKGGRWAISDRSAL
ncbi:metallo-beta-lactamase superfamily protein [Diaporthe helianthi]|uniref:Metallo-beta-lactamase superfamily protein n=1 Tax=Diaporthe helianthi TaxID=158607 RepID=A0A2P5IEI7_DIAHE|nr:metallo-beta-lactamase superfamily protein [Diaporthe helianthi]